MKKLLAVCAVFAFTNSMAMAFPLIDTRTDTTPGGAVVDQSLGANEYGPGNSYQYLGGGNGFGGTVGNGALYLESDNANLYIGMQFGNALNDLVAILIDTKAGGFTDATMNDNGDGCRRALTQQTINADDAYDPGFLADYGVCIGNFGNVEFDLSPGNPITFLNFDGTGSQPFREYAVSLASLGIAPGGAVNFFVGYVSDGGFNSNESIPAYGPLNGGANPGFDGPSPGYGNYDRFNSYPEPSTLALLGFAGFAVIRRRR